MLTCKEAARLIASDEFAEAGLWRRMAVGAHVLMCRHCRRYARQIRALGEHARERCAEQPQDPVALQRLESAILRRFPASPDPPDRPRGGSDLPPGDHKG